MKAILIATITMLFLLSACSTHEQKEHSPEADTDEFVEGEKYATAVNKGLQADTMKPSVQRSTKQMIDENNMVISYHSPGVRGRIIWGGLVPYDQVWVTGAHSATKISFTKDIRFQTKTVPAGTYAIFTIPGKTNWNFIVNKNFEQHLADDYRQEEDVVRLTIEPEKLKDSTQRLSYTIEQNGQGTGSIKMAWETLQLTIPFTVLQQSSTTHSMKTVRKKLTGITPDSKKDLVCYMPIKAGITDSFTFKKKLYGFCSAECKALFVKDPAHYIADAKE